MATIHTQYNFANGEISRRFWGRSDIPLYFQSVAAATNVLVSESGSLTKRQGFETIVTGDVATQLIPLFITSVGFFLAEFSPLKLRIIDPNASSPIIATIVTTYEEQDLFAIQHAVFGNSLFITHQNHQPMVLTVANDVWTLAADSAGSWNSSGNYPAIVSFYKQRKMFAASINNPRRIGFSKIGDYTDFTVGTDPDSPIEISLASDTNDEIVTILPFETFFVFTKAGVWGNDNPRELTPQNISFSKRSNIGCSDRVRPVILKNNILYVPQSRDDIYLFQYNFDSNKFSNISLTRTARHLFDKKKIINWATSDINDLVLIIFEVEEGGCTGREVVCLKYDPVSNLHGYTVWDTEALLGDIASDLLGNTFFFATARSASNNLEKVNLLGDVFEDPTPSSEYTVGITTLPLEGAGKYIEDRAQSSIVYAKTNNTLSMGVKGISTENEFTDCECTGETETIEVDINSEITRNSQIYFRNVDDDNFELLAYSVVGKVNTRGESPQRGAR